MPYFAEHLKQLRKDNKVSQKKLAEYLNVSQNAVFQWENEKCEPSIDMIEKIAKYFHVTPNYLMGWDNVPRGTSYSIPKVSQIFAKYFENEQDLTEEEWELIENIIKYIKSKRLKSKKSKSISSFKGRKQDIDIPSFLKNEESKI